MVQTTPAIGIIVGSTRPGRNAKAVADWTAEHARQRQDARFELVDIADFDLPLLDEPLSALASVRMNEPYLREHTRLWSETVRSLDGFVIVTPEYNFGVPAALKNAIDYLHPEWNNKAAGFVSYGSQGGVRATAQLRQILGEVQVATVSPEVNLSLYNDFEHFTVFKPADMHAAQLQAMLDQLVAWTGAFMPLRGVANV